MSYGYRWIKAIKSITIGLLPIVIDFCKLHPANRPEEEMRSYGTGRYSSEAGQFYGYNHM